MFKIKTSIILLFVLNKYIYFSDATARSNKFHKLGLISNTLNTPNLPSKKVKEFKKLEKGWKEQTVPSKYATVLCPLFDKFESYRGRLLLDLQLQKVTLYYAVDYSNNPVLCHNVDRPNDVKYKQPSQFYKVKTPNYYTLVNEFLNLFSQEKDEIKEAVYSLEELNHELPNAVLLFMDPNSCADHVVELNKQEKEAKMSKTKLNKVFRLFERGLNFYRDKDTVNLLLPLSSSLVYATNTGGSSFKGTPVFTTDPPVHVTKDSKWNNPPKTNEQDFDKFEKGSKFVVFFDPEEAKEFYKKVRWNKVYKDESTGNVYRVWSKSPPFKPNVKVTSLEKVYKKVHSYEPYWGYLLEFVPPTLKLEKRTESMLKESNNLLLVPWYTFKKLYRRGLNLMN